MKGWGGGIGLSAKPPPRREGSRRVLDLGTIFQKVFSGKKEKTLFTCNQTMGDFFFQSGKKNKPLFKRFKVGV